MRYELLIEHEQKQLQSKSIDRTWKKTIAYSEIIDRT
jgi:hypothetical protein